MGLDPAQRPGYEITSASAWLIVVVPIAVAAVGAFIHGVYHAGQDAERFRDIERRLRRLERRAGFPANNDE